MFEAREKYPYYKGYRELLRAWRNDRLDALYALYPTRVKTLGAAALSAVMSHMSQNRRR